MNINDRVRAESMLYGIVIIGTIEWAREKEVSIYDGNDSRIVSAETWIVEVV